MSALAHPVIRMNGTSNAFYVLDAREDPQSGFPALARRLCAPSASDPADGLLVVLPSRRYDAMMRMFNPDGSEAEMCGNGVRCVARYLSEVDGRDAATIETLAGPIGVGVVTKDPVFEVRVDMGIPAAAAAGSVIVDDETVDYIPVDVGNPHVVVFVHDVRDVDLERIGPQIATHASFRGGTNVHFVQVIDAHTLDVRHWERGAGATPACGTGAVASAVAAIGAHQVASPVDVRVPGGDLVVELAPDGRAFMTGSAVREYERVLTG